MKSVTNVTTQQQQNPFIYLFDTTKTNIKYLFIVTLSYKVNKQNQRFFILLVRTINKEHQGCFYLFQDIGSMIIMGICCILCLKIDVSFFSG